MAVIWKLPDTGARLFDESGWGVSVFDEELEDVVAGGDTITCTGIASAETFGSHTLTFTYNSLPMFSPAQRMLRSILQM